jgi:hypothetical protein
MIHTITIPDWLPPTLNQIMRGKLRTRMQLCRQCHKTIRSYGLAQKIPRATAKRRLTIKLTFGPGKRMCDPDSPLKAVADALVRAGLLRGDRYNDVEHMPVVFNRGPKSATILVLEDT